MKKIILILFFQLIIINVRAQDQTRHHETALNIGIARTGVCFGNAYRHTGLRINWKDEYLQAVNGFNLTLWNPGKNVPGSVNGVAFGLVAPEADYLNGVTIGTVAGMANQQMNGINFGGIALVSQGEINGFSLAGIGLVAEKSITGINITGGGLVSEKSITGLNIGGFACVSSGRVSGFTLGGLAAVSKGRMTGLNIGGLALIGTGGLTGINAGGLAVVSEESVNGLNIGGLALIGEKSVTGITLAGLAILSEGPVTGFNFTPGQLETKESFSGINFCLYRAKSHAMNGFNFVAGYNRCERSLGLNIGGWNRSDEIHTGLSIGLVNIAAKLKGVQIGLVNYVKENPAPFKALPLINARF